MKKRWMKSVIEASKQDVAALPFQRGARCTRREEMLISALRATA